MNWFFRLRDVDWTYRYLDRRVQGEPVADRSDPRGVRPRRYRIRQFAFLAAATAAWGLSGCSEPTPLAADGAVPNVQAGEAGVGSAMSSGAAGAPAAFAPPKADISLTPAEYVERGFPPVDRPWSAGEMNQARQVLEQLAQQEPQHLPRFQSERSGEVFARMISSDNFDAYRESSEPFESRLANLGQHVQSIMPLMELYRRQAKLDASRRQELVEWMGAIFRAVVVYLELVDQFEEQIPEGDPRAALLHQMATRLRAMPATKYSGFLEVFIRADAGDTDDMRAILAQLNATYPQIARRLPAGVVADSIIRIDRLLQDEKLKPLHPELNELREGIQASLDEIRSAR